MISKSLWRKTKKSVEFKKFTMKDSDSSNGADDHKNTKVELDYKTPNPASGDPDPSNQTVRHEFKLTLVETKYSEKNLPEKYEFKGLEIIQKIENPSGSFSQAYTSADEKFDLGKIESSVESIVLTLKLSKSDTGKTEVKLDAFAEERTAELDKIWKMMIGGVPNPAEGRSLLQIVLITGLIGVLLVGLIVGIYCLSA